MSNDKNIVSWIISILCLCVILEGQVCFGQTQGWKSERKAVVLDANGSPVAGAKIYRRASFTVNTQKGDISLSEEANTIAKADAHGEFFFDMPKLGVGVLFLAVDESLSRIGYLRVQRKDQNDVYAITVAAPGRIKATLESKQVPLSSLLVDIGFYEPHKRRILGGFMTFDYRLDEAADSIPLDMICPSQCNLKFIIRQQEFLKDIEKDIPSLVPGEVFDLGRVTMEPVYDYGLIGKKPPELEVAEWVKGTPTTLEKLKGKVVLLDFWGLWCGPCRERFAKLVELHKKYSGDGLVIIAIHDSSLDRASLIEQGQKAVNLSGVRFRVATDSPASESSGTQARGAGKGKTIEAYGIYKFPTLVLIAQDGEVDHVDKVQLLEERINLLLYGHTKNLNRELSFHQELLLLARKEFLLAGIGIAGLLFVSIYCAVRLRTNKQTKQV